jgi:glycosyl transferase family 1
MIAYFFPPLGGGGVQRSLKHVKYLPHAGFEPIVLTTRTTRTSSPDATLTGDVPPGTPIIRAPEVPLQFLRWGLEGALGRAGLPKWPAANVSWPDEHAGWIPAATWHALRAVRRYRPQVIYSTASPVSAHVVAMLVSRRTGLPWVADFRDAWTLAPTRERVVKPLARASSKLERAFVRQARVVTIVDESIEVDGLPPTDPRRVLIRNGVDPDDVPEFNGQSVSGRFTLAHVGKMYGKRDGAPVFAALRALVDRGDVDPRRLEVRIVGRTSVSPGVDLDGIRVTHTGYVDHAAAVAEMQAADVLLLYVPDRNWPAPGKIYEYLVAGRPVLCVAPADNFSRRLVGELTAGPGVDPGDQPAIEEAIKELYGKWRSRSLHVSPTVRAETLSRFSRETQARELATVLAAV